MKTQSPEHRSVPEIDPGVYAPPELFRFMVESMTDGGVLLDHDGIIIYANQAICTLSGYSRNELTGNDCIFFFNPDEYSLVRKISSGSANRPDDPIRTLLRSKSGEEIYVVITWNSYSDFRGEIEGVCLLFKDVTRETKLESELAEGKERYKQFYDNQDEGMGIVNRHEEFVFVNKAAERIFDVPPGTLVSRTLLDFIAPDEVAQLIRETEKRSQLIRSTYETKIDTPAGQRKHLLVTASPEVNKEGIQCGTFAIFRDITELKHIQETLLQGEQKYRTLFESAQDAIFLIHDEKFMDCNPATLRMFACERQEIIGQSPEKFCPLVQSDGIKSYERITAQINLALEGRPRPFEFQHIDLNGKVFDAEIILTPIEVDAKGMILAFVRDITVRKHTEMALLQSEQKYRDLANLLPTTIFESDLNGNLIYANRTGLEWFGFTEEEILQGVPVFSFISPQHRQIASSSFADIIDNNKISSGEYLAQKKNGETFDVFITSRAIVKDGKPIGIRGNIIDITKQKKAEEANLKLASIVESSDDAIIGKTLEGMVTSWNKGAENIFGYSAQEMLGNDLSILSTPETRQEETHFLNEIKNGGHIKHYETKRRKKNGNEIEISLTISPIRNRVGEIVGAASIARDITERRNAEKLRVAKEAAESLLRSEEKFSKAFHNSPVPICITTLYNPHFVEFNESFEEQTGYTKEELKDQSLTDLPIFHDQEDLKKIIQLLTTKGFTRNQEIPFYIKNGEKRICLLSSEVIELGGEPCALTVLLDITERRLAEQTIAESQQRFELLVEQTLVGFIECDINFIIRSWNPSAERIFGYSAAEAIGRHVGNLIVRPDDQPERNKLWCDILMSEGGISTTNENLTKNQQIITCEWHDTAIIDPSGIVIGIVSLVADITERIASEKALENSREQLKHFAQHLQTVREEERVHISRELHDSLGQSLTGLKMFAFNIFNKLSVDNTSLDLNKVRNQAKEIIGIIDDIMQQVRKIAKDIRPRILDEFGLIPAIESHIREITNHTQIKYEVIKRVHKVELDPAYSIEVFRIFQEACTNIIRHANATKITITISTSGEFYVLRIEDNGCGIKDTDISKLKSLGLLGMKERSQVFGGDLQITGTEGEGTNVVLTIPKKEKK